MPELRNAVVTVGNPGLNGTGVSAPEKTDIFNRLTALEAVTPVVNIGDLADVDLSGAAVGDHLVFDGTDVVPETPAAITVTSAISFLIDGGGATITTGVKGDLSIPFACTITGWRVLADQSGSISVGVWKDTYANYPPVVGDLLVTPAITTATKNEATGLSHAVTAGDTLRFNVTSVTSHQRVTITLTITRSVGP